MYVMLNVYIITSFKVVQNLIIEKEGANVAIRILLKAIS